VQHPRQLRIDFDGCSLADVFAALDQCLTDGWSRAAAVEAQWAPTLRDIQACYECDARGSRPASCLTLPWMSGSSVGVGYVWPAGERLSYDCQVAVWNTVVTDFHASCLAKIDPATVADLHLSVGLWSEEVCVEELMSPQAFALLKPMADDSTFWLGQVQWEEFIRLLSIERHRLTPPILKAWLLEQGWPAFAASKRADEFALALVDD
jgi:hypothetical protein